MKLLRLIALLVTFTGCSSVKPEYQNNFYIGCMNAYLKFTAKPTVNKDTIENANKWCRKQYEKMRDL